MIVFALDCAESIQAQFSHNEDKEKYYCNVQYKHIIKFLQVAKKSSIVSSLLFDLTLKKVIFYAL